MNTGQQLRALLCLMASGCSYDIVKEPSDPPESRPSAGMTAAPATGSRGPSAADAAPQVSGAAPTSGPTPATDPAPGAPPAPKPGPGLTVAGTDDCSARIVSRSRPCSNDPDPCGLNSGWDGDEYCLLPPPASEGIQIHFGPKSYSDTSDTAGYVIEPGQNLNHSVLARVPLDSDRWVQRITVHMRPGVDHWVSLQGPADGREGFYPDTGCGSGQTFGSGGIGGGQNLIYDNPPHGVAAPENEGIVRKIAGNSSMCMAIQHINSSKKPQLREVWVNLYFTDEPQTVVTAKGIGVIGELGIAVQPGAKHESTWQGTFTEDGRILQLFGHRKRWTPRFAVWLNEELIYDSRQREEMVTYNFDSITANPPIDPSGMKDGAVSGILPFKAGDTLKFTCFVDNHSGNTLRFVNEVENGEMCNLWGSAVGSGLSGMF